MPLTVKDVKKVGKAAKAIAMAFDSSLVYINIVFPETNEVHRFSAEKSVLGHIESHTMTETVLLNDQELSDASPY